MKIVAVDWDGTLYEHGTGWLPDAKRALKVMKRRGYRVIVHSCRAQSPYGADQIRAVLDAAGYRFEVTAVKPDADVYIDNKALRFDGDWSTTLSQL